MQTSAAIATAAVAQERTPVTKVLVDWDGNGNYTDSYDDLTSRVESVTIDRQLATDLPDEVSRVAGYSAADLTVTLSGDPTTEITNAASYFSPFNTSSPLYGKRRRWRNVQVQMGFGTTFLTVFTGKTTGLTVDSASRTATLTAVDNAETMRGTVDLPMIVADDRAYSNPVTGTIAVRPGLDGAWVVDYIARRCGYFASPPARTNCVFLATMSGSAWAEVGTTIWAEDPNGIPVVSTAGKFISGIGAAVPGGTPNLQYKPTSTLSTNNNGELLLEGWVLLPSTAVYGLASMVNASVFTGSNGVGLLTDASNHLVVAYRRTNGGAIATYNTGVVVPANQWSYVAAHVYFTSTNITIHARVNSTNATTTIASSSVTGQPALTFVYLARAEDGAGLVQFSQGGHFEAWQLSNPGTTTSAPTWNDSYTGNSVIQTSLNELTATVPSTASAWEQIQLIAAAELATAGFDELGNYFYYPRDRWTAAPYTTSQRTINASDSLTAIATSENTDQIRDHVRIDASPLGLNAAAWVWAAAAAISVPASGSTTITADTGSPVYNLSTSIRYASSSGMSGQSQYRANTASNGSGTAVSNLTFAVTVAAGQLVTITITNPNAFVVYLVSGSGFTDPAGTPSLALWGQPVTPIQAQQPDTTANYTVAAAGQLVDVSDAMSIAQHGDQLLDLTGNPWHQDVTSLKSLANDLLARLKDPPPMLDGLTIIGDPRLQLGDRVTVVAPALGLNGDFFLTGITSTFDSSGYTQALTVRAIS
jgi:hypothetical protein